MASQLPLSGAPIPQKKKWGWKMITLICVSLVIMLGLALGLGLGLGLRSGNEDTESTSSPSTTNSTDPDFGLGLGDWTIERVSSKRASGTCVTLNNNTAYGTVDQPEYWSTCGSYFGPNTYTVSQLSNGSYALAGSFPAEFQNELAFPPSLTDMPLYQWLIPFVNTAGTCDVTTQLIVGFGRTRDEYQIMLMSLNPSTCEVEGATVPSGFTCDCFYDGPGITA